MYYTDDLLGYSCSLESLDQKNKKELKSLPECEVLGIDDLSKIFHNVQSIMSIDFILPKPLTVTFFLLCV